MNGKAKKTSVLWIQHASEWVLLDEVARALEELGVDSTFVCKTATAQRALEERGHNVQSVIDVMSGESQISDEAIAALDKKYGPPGVTSMCLSDVHFRFLFGSDEQAKKQLVARMHQYWEQFFDTHAVDAIIARETAQVSTRTAYKVARARGIPFFIIGYAPVPDSFILCDRGELPQWSELHDALRTGYQVLSDAQQGQVIEFVQKRVPDSSKPMTLRFMPLSFLSALRQYAGYVRYDTKQRKKCDPSYIASIRYEKYRLRKKMIWKYITRHFLHYDEPNEHDAFVYFPVYSGLETSYLVHTPFWAYHEYELIREVAARLPEGVLLYIKEHPLNPGDLTYRELKALKEIPNVRIIQPHVSSQYLVEKSKLVVTLEGTTGWEALISKNPVLCLAPVSFYSLSSCVYEGYDLQNLERDIWRALQKGSDIYCEKESEWLWFIHAVMSTVYEGRMVNQKPPYGFPTDEENARKIARSVADKIRRAATGGKRDTA